MQNFEKFRAVVNASSELQAQVKSGANLLALAQANGVELSQSELDAGMEQLNNADADLSDFELGLIAGGALSCNIGNIK